MVNMLAYENQKRELEELVAAAKALIAYYSEDMWKIESIHKIEQLKSFLGKRPIVDIACYDVSSKMNIEFLRKIRTDGYEKTILMLLADDKMSPMEYVKPEILASELLVKPYTNVQLKNKLRDLLSLFCNKLENTREEDIFVLETKDGKTRIPFNLIYYFEARDKKIYVRTLTAEYPFYQTLEELKEFLPEWFLRCHRSYIVNWRLVERIDLTNSELVLADELYVPVSRTYRDQIKKHR